jgi:hypothetical protein
MGNRQSAIFARVGRKLVQDQSQVQGGRWIEHERRSRAGDTVVVGTAEQNLLADEVHHLGASQLGLGQQIMRPCERLHTPAEAAHEVARGPRMLQRLAGDRLHGRQRVLDAMIELVEQQALQLLGALALGDVASDLRRADHASRPVTQR